MKNLFLVVLAVCLLVGCSKNDENNDINDDSLKVIMPLGVGYTWNYIDSTFTSAGKVESVDSSRLGITGYINDSIKAYLWNWYDFESKKYDDAPWLVNTNDKGFILYGFTYNNVRYFNNNKNNYLYFIYPVNLNDKWTAFDMDYVVDESNKKVTIHSDTINCVCSSISKKLHTKAGDFDCYIYTSSKTNSEGNVIEQSMYFAPNVGYVGGIQKKNGNVFYKKILKSYSLVSTGTSVSKVKSKQNLINAKNHNFFGIER